MPASVSFSAPSCRLTTDLVARLASSDREVQLKALRELKNQIIGNRTKKLTFIKLGAVPAVASVLSDAIEGGYDPNLLVQSAAALGSFACGFDAGVRAVLDAGALPNLVRLLSSPDEKVVDSGARSLKMIYQSNLAPKYDFLDTGSMEFLLSLLNSKSENVTGLGAVIISHSCKTSTEQKVLCEAQVMIKLVDFLGGSLSQKEASLECLASLIKNNPEVACKFAEFEAGKALNLIIKATLDRSPRTRLLACACLVSLRNVSPSYLKSKGMETKLIHYLLELLEDPGHVGDEASFILSSLVEDNEDLQKVTFDANAIEILCNHLQKELLRPRRVEGIILALANVCANLEICRSKLLPLEAFNLVNDALSHDCGDVRVAACLCLRSVSRSVQKLSAGFFKKEKIVTPLLQLLHDPDSTVQLEALRAISNIVIDFRTRESTFVRCGGLEQLLQLSMSMNSTMRLNSLWALRNFTFHADNKCKEGVFSGLTASSLASLICDTDSTVQEQALALVRNLIDGSLDSIEYVFAEDCRILDATTRQLQRSSTAEVGIQSAMMQGMHVLNNVASGTEVHKDAVMDKLLQHGGGNDTHPFILRFLQSSDSKLRTVSVWLIVNLTNSSSPGAPSRVAKLRDAGVVTQLKSMSNDPCLDVKLRVRTILGQYMTFGDS